MLCSAAPEKVSALNLKRLKADNKTYGQSQKPAGATGGLPVFYARVRGQGGSSHKWQLRCKCADPSAVFQQHAALFLHIRSTPFG